MKVYVLTRGTGVLSVHQREEDARGRAEESLKSLVDVLETEWRSQWDGQNELFYKSARYGRWNGSKYFVTATDLDT